jgi:HptB-dependent secretion and biofilm anti anti-sigma factor
VFVLPSDINVNGALMNTLESNKLLINVSAASNTATIYLNGSFTFDAFREFKTAYKSQLNDSLINDIIVDLEKVQYLDSSALEMLMVLREQVKLAGKSLRLSKPNLFIKRVFDIANFQELFVIA